MNSCLNHNAASVFSALEAVIPWGISHHLSTIRHHKFTKYIPPVDLEGGDVKKKNVVSVAIPQ